MSSSDISHQSVGKRSSVEDWRGLGDLVALATERITDPIEGTHNAIADRWLGSTGRDTARGTFIHRAITRKLYGSVRLGGSVAGASLDIGASIVGRQRQLRPLWNSSVGGGVRAAANALWGDEFERRSSPMHTELGLRDINGAHIGIDADNLATAFTSPTQTLAVLIHGLGKTEHCWCDREGDTGAVVGLASTLEADGFTPLLVRYNSGRRVADNGNALASLLENVTSSWSTPISNIVLIGHSMGGLVAQTALQAGHCAAHDWVESVRHLVTIGTPHSGSPLEKGAHLASQILRTISVSRPIGEFIDERSAGIKDMRYGTVLCDTNHVADVLLGIRTQHHQIAGVVTSNSPDIVGFLVGDLVVRVNSATGGGSSGYVEASNKRVFRGLNHLALLHDPTVHRQISEWITAS